MTWQCPDDWIYVPEMQPASEGMLMALMIAGTPRWQLVRAPWFRRCNATGKWIWPLQKGWTGVVGINHSRHESFDQTVKGSYCIAWLNKDQYIIQKLKGNI